MKFPNKKYSIIYIDPPWEVKRGPDWNSNGPSNPLPYSTMTIDEIKQLPIKNLCKKNAWLFLWTINKYISEAYDIAKYWGFKVSCLLTWIKPKHGIGIGGTFVQTSEHLLFCRKGTLTATKRIDTTWFEYPRRKHSEKPHEIRTMINEIAPDDTKKIELFARIKTEGWDAWGNDIKQNDRGCINVKENRF